MKFITKSCFISSCFTFSLTLLIVTLFCFAAGAEDNSAPDYDITQRDAAARDAALVEESERTWRSKPPHPHTKEDAKNSALQNRKTNPRHLIRDKTQKGNIEERIEINLQQLESDPDFPGNEASRNEIMEQVRNQALIDAGVKRQKNQAQAGGPKNDPSHHGDSGSSPPSQK